MKLSETKLSESKKPAWKIVLALMIPVIVFCIGLAMFHNQPFASKGFPLDDAWIHRVYARSFATGNGFAYNPGQQETGATSPFWAIISAPVHWLQPLGDPGVIFAVKILNALLGLLILGSLFFIVLKLTGSIIASSFSAALMAVAPRLLFSTLSGMETNLLLALLSLASLSLLHQRHFLFLLFMSLAPVTRPEAAVLLPLCLFALIPVTQSSKSVWKKLSFWIIPMLPSAIWSLFCFIVSGHPLPATFYNKAHTFGLNIVEMDIGFMVVHQYPLFHPIAMWSAVTVFAGSLLLIRSRHWLSVLCFFPLAPLIYLAGVVGSRDIHLVGFYWSRWLDPASLMFTMTACMGFGVFISWMFSRKSRIQKTIILVIAASLLLMSWSSFRYSWTERIARLESDTHVIEKMNVAMGKWLAENTSPDQVLAVNDAGAIGYYSHRRIIDLMGLNCHEITFGHLQRYDAMQQSDWLVIFPIIFVKMGIFDLLTAGFQERFTVRLSKQEYTVTDAVEQTVMTAYERIGNPGDNSNELRSQ